MESLGLICYMVSNSLCWPTQADEMFGECVIMNKCYLAQLSDCFCLLILHEEIFIWDIMVFGLFSLPALTSPTSTFLPALPLLRHSSCHLTVMPILQHCYAEFPQQKLILYCSSSKAICLQSHM